MVQRTCSCPLMDAVPVLDRKVRSDAKPYHRVHHTMGWSRAAAADDLGALRVVDQQTSSCSLLQKRRHGQLSRMHSVDCLAIRPHSTQCALARRGGSLELLDADSGSSETELPSTSFATTRALRWLSDSLLARITSDGSLELAAHQSDSSWSISLSSSVGTPAHCSDFSRNDTARFAAVAGRGRQLTVLDIEQRCKPVFRAKPNPPDKSGWEDRACFSSVSFAGPADNSCQHLLFAGAHKEVRLYDSRAQRHAVMTTKWGDGDVFATCSPAIESSNTVLYAGNAQGRVAGFDMRSSLQHTAGFRGCQGSVRSIALHPTEPKMAVYGLDRYIHLYSTSTHKQLGALYTKQHGTSIDFFDEVFFSDDKQDLRSQHESANGRGRKRVQPDSSDNEDDDGNEERNKNDSL